MSARSRRKADTSSRLLRHAGSPLVEARGIVAKADPGISRSQEEVSTTKDAALRIVIEPNATGKKWAARLDDRILCIAAAPFVQSARVLLAEGYSPHIRIEMWRPGAAAWALRGRVGPVAAVVLHGERRAKNDPPVDDDGRG